MSGCPDKKRLHSQKAVVHLVAKDSAIVPSAHWGCNGRSSVEKGGLQLLLGGPGKHAGWIDGAPVPRVHQYLHRPRSQLPRLTLQPSRSWETDQLMHPYVGHWEDINSVTTYPDP